MGFEGKKTNELFCVMEEDELVCPAIGGWTDGNPICKLWPEHRIILEPETHYCYCGRQIMAFSRWQLPETVMAPITDSITRVKALSDESRDILAQIVTGACGKCKKLGLVSLTPDGPLCSACYLERNEVKGEHE